MDQEFSEERRDVLRRAMDMFRTQRMAATSLETVRTRAEELNDMLGSAQTEIEHLRADALTNRRIGMAIGILMGRRKLTEDEAFDRLRASSEQQHDKLRDIAEDVIWTGDLPPDPRARRTES